MKKKRKRGSRITTDKYINPFTDYGFKRLFGEEPQKDILLDFLNTLLYKEEGKIKSLNFLKSEKLGVLDTDRKAIFDIYCENEKGEKFIVEMQKAKHNFFKERSVYYSTFPIREQAEKGNWDYNLKSVYTIGILDFVFEENKDDKDKFFYKVKLSDIETKKVFFDKLTYIYLEMPKFKKTESELETNFDKWLYVLKNLPDLLNRPPKLQEKVFKKLFKVAEIANFDEDQLDIYEESLKVYRDMYGVIKSAKDNTKKKLKEKYEKKIIETEKKRKQAESERKQEAEKRKLAESERKLEAEKRKQAEIKLLNIANKMKSEGMDVNDISKLTGLSTEEIKKLK